MALASTTSTSTTDAIAAPTATTKLWTDKNDHNDISSVWLYFVVNRRASVATAHNIYLQAYEYL